MDRKPGFFSDIGRRARELIYGDYVKQPPIHYRFAHFDSSFHLLCEINKILSGLSTVIQVVIPYQRLCRVELRYLHDYAGIKMGVSMTKYPLIHFSAALGTSLCSVGTAISVDSRLRQFSRYDAGLSFNTRFLDAAVTLTEKGDALNGSCYLKPLTGTAFAAELTHRFLRNETSAKLGGQFSPCGSLLVEARVGTDGGIGALVQLGCFSALVLTISGETTVKDIRRAKMGMSCSLNCEIAHHLVTSIGVPFNCSLHH